MWKTTLVKENHLGLFSCTVPACWAFTAKLGSKTAQEMVKNHHVCRGTVPNYPELHFVSVPFGYRAMQTQESVSGHQSYRCPGLKDTCTVSCSKYGSEDKCSLGRHTVQVPDALICKKAVQSVKGKDETQYDWNKNPQVPYPWNHNLACSLGTLRNR